jgi:tetratricopeptide (TPR) repeat protein
MARLSHPNVVQVYEVIRLGERTAIVMELVEGEELGVWQQGQPWRAIIDAYVQASRGLAAAHRAGIVHRDFKPSNVLVARDGVVRVTDFGVARRGAGDAPVEATTIGTPVYMAPEQHRKATIDARTDQWALGCAVYEALYGRRPFASAEAGDLAAAVTRGEIEEEPADSPVPRRIRAAIRRALATEPDDRFASVDELAAALSRRPRYVPYLVGGVATIVLAIPIALFARSDHDSACTGLDAPMRATWSDTTRADLRARLLAPGVGLPEATIDRALRGLDAYATAWSTTRTRTCTDAKQGVRSAGTLDARMRCLDHRLAEVSGLLEGLASNEAKTLRATSDAIAQLRPIAACADAEGRPSSPAVDTAEDELARAIALMSLGKYEQVIPLVEQTIRTAEQAGAASLTARALVVRGECEDRLRRYPDALATYQRAAKAAAQARDHAVVADALVHAFLVEGDHLGRRADALRARPFVELAVESAGQPDAVRAAWLHYLAILLYDDASLVEQAVAYERESLAIRQRTLPPGHVYILDSIETLANIEGARKNFDEASRLLQQVLDARIASRGPNDAMVSSAYNNLGVVEIRRNELLAALRYLQPAVDISRAAGTPNSSAIFNLGLTQLELGRAGAAVETFVLSLEAAQQMSGTGSRQVAASMIYVGIANIAAGNIERGRPLLLAGVEAARRAGSPTLTSGLSHAARLALHDGDRQKARVLLDEALKLPAANAPLRTLVTAELARAEGGCATARAKFARTLEDATAGNERRVQTLATIGLAACELAAGDTRAARTRVEAELAWLEKVGADDTVKAPFRALLRQ